MAGAPFYTDEDPVEKLLRLRRKQRPGASGLRDSFGATAPEYGLSPEEQALTGQGDWGGAPETPPPAPEEPAAAEPDIPKFKNRLEEFNWWSAKYGEWNRNIEDADKRLAEAEKAAAGIDPVLDPGRHIAATSDVEAFKKKLAEAKKQRDELEQILKDNSAPGPRIALTIAANKIGLPKWLAQKWDQDVWQGYGGAEKTVNALTEALSFAGDQAKTVIGGAYDVPAALLGSTDSAMRLHKGLDAAEESPTLLKPFAFNRAYGRQVAEDVGQFNADSTTLRVVRGALTFGGSEAGRYLVPKVINTFRDPNTEKMMTGRDVDSLLGTLAFEIATDPMNLVGAGIGKAGKLSKLQKPLRGALETGARYEALQAVNLERQLSKEAFRRVANGTADLQVELVKAGYRGEEAFKKSQQFADAFEMRKADLMNQTPEALRARLMSGGMSDEARAVWDSLPPDVQRIVDEQDILKRLNEEVPRRPLRGTREDRLNYRQVVGEKRMEVLGAVPPEYRSQVLEYAKRAKSSSGKKVVHPEQVRAVEEATGLGAMDTPFQKGTLREQFAAGQRGRLDPWRPVMKILDETGNLGWDRLAEKFPALGKAISQNSILDKARRITAKMFVSDVPYDQLDMHYAAQMASDLDHAGLREFALERAQAYADAMKNIPPDLQKFTETDVLPTLTEKFGLERKAWLREGIATPTEGSVLDEFVSQGGKLEDVLHLSDIYDQTKALERELRIAKGIDSPELVMGDRVVGYYDKDFSQEFRAMIARDERLREAVYGTAENFESKGFKDAKFLRERTAKDIPLDEHEAFLRDEWGVPKDIPIFERNAEKQSVSQVLGASKQLEKQHHYNTFVREFGEPIGNVDDAVEIVRDVLEKLQEARGFRAAKAEGKARKLAGQATEYKGAKPFVGRALRNQEKIAGSQGMDRAKLLTADAARDRLKPVGEKARIISEKKSGIGAAEKGLEEAKAAVEKQRLFDIAGPNFVDTPEGLLDAANVSVNPQTPDIWKAAIKDAKARKVTVEAAYLQNRLTEIRRRLASDAENIFAKTNFVEEKFVQRIAEAHKELGAAKTISDVRGAMSRLSGDMRALLPAGWKRKVERDLADALKQLQTIRAAQGVAAPGIGRTLTGAARRAENIADEQFELFRQTDPELWDADQTGRFFEYALRKNGIEPPKGYTSALELARTSHHVLPESTEELMKLATTWVKESDVKAFATHAPGLAAIDRPNKFWRMYDEFINTVYKKPVLANIPGALNDVVSTALWGIAAGVSPADLRWADDALGGFDSVLKGTIGKDPLVVKAYTSGILETPERAAQVAGITKTPSEFGRVGDVLQERGLLGAAFGEKVGGKIGKFTTGIIQFRQYGEQVARMALYRNRISKGWTHADAAADVSKYFGNMREYTKFERSVLNRMLFFWSWQKRALKGSMRMIYERPINARIMQILAAGNANDEDIDEWYKKQGGWVLGRKGGKPYVISTGGLSWLQPLNSGLQSMVLEQDKQRSIFGLGRGAANALLSQANPAVQAGVEIATGREVFSGKLIEDRTGREAVADKVPAAVAVPLRALGLGEAFGIYEKKEGDTLLYYRTKNSATKWVIESLFPGAAMLANQANPLFEAADSQRDYDEAIIMAASRQLGRPIYSLSTTQKTVEMRKLKAMSDEVRRTIEDLDGHPLRIDDYGNVLFDDSTAAGQKLKAAYEADTGGKPSTAAERARWLVANSYDLGILMRMATGLRTLREAMSGDGPAPLSRLRGTQILRGEFENKR